MLLDLLFNNKKKKFNKRKLEERSHLAFHFPQPNGSSFRAYLPFLENCQVSESGKANLGEYNLLGRSGSLFSYNSGKSRVFNVTFKITFLHVIETLGKDGIDERFKQHYSLFYETKDAARNAFFELMNNPFNESYPGEKKDIKSFPHAKTHREFYQRVANIRTSTPNFFDAGVNSVLSFLGSPNETTDQRYEYLNKVIDLIIFWVNLVRCSVKNNSKDTTLGPPIVRLTHGVSYNNIPCVVDSYSIRGVDEAGYDMQTLLNKQIEVSMVMSETRVGNFGDFKVAQLQDSDNNAGWEAVLDSNNMDPYGGLI